MALTALLGACGGEPDARVRYSSVFCTYAGSRTLPGAQVEIAFDNEDEAVAASLVVFEVGVETTVRSLSQAAAEDRATDILGPGFMDVPTLRRVEARPGEAARLVRELPPGRYALACVTATDQMIPAAVVEIGGR